MPIPNATMSSADDYHRDRVYRGDNRRIAGDDTAAASMPRRRSAIIIDNISLHLTAHHSQVSTIITGGSHIAGLFGDVPRRPSENGR
jgi:hypothetical protein